MWSSQGDRSNTRPDVLGRPFQGATGVNRVPCTTSVEGMYYVRS